MTAGKRVRIGGAAAAWGDTLHGARQLVEAGGIDYLVGDWLAEVTMAILSRQRARDPAGGFVPDWIASVAPVLPQVKAQCIRLITNAGGMNPQACAEAFARAAEAAGAAFRVAVVTGDDLSAQAEAIRAAAPADMFTGAPAPAKFASLNAYLGAGAIAEALAAGAEVVICGRVVDSALALGPLIHEFGWGPRDWDLLAQGALAGHVIECGAQATGGLFTDWREVAPGWDDMGFPIIEVGPDGAFTVTKPEGTGGLVSVGTVAEQIVYEIGDPRAYRLPDVTCDFTGVQVVQDGPDRVRVSGARGRPPGPDLKVCATWADGFRVVTTYLIAGFEAGAKGRAMAEALVRRVSRLAAGAGFAPWREVSIEVIGAEETWGRHRAGAREVVVKIALRHDDPKALEIFAKEFAHPGVSMAQGVTGVLFGRPKPQPVVRVHSFLWPKAEVPVQVALDDRSWQAATAETETDPGPSLAPPPAAPAPATPETALVPLRALAWGRSGDKGDDANIGVIARKAEFAALIDGQVTESAVAGFFAHLLDGPKGGGKAVTRWTLPGFHAVNFLLRGALGGGGSGSLRYDPQAKTFAQMLLDMDVRVPADWLAQDGPLADWARKNERTPA